MQSISRLIEKSKNARKGFTVLELLVASLLLGMLMTILTMIFNQSSIAWRMGDASVRTTAGKCEGVADFRHDADNLYPWKGQAYIIPSIFGDDGKVLTSRNNYIKSGSTVIAKVPGESADVQESYVTDLQPPEKRSGVSGGSGQNGDANYIVNVKSSGPDRNKNGRYDNIYGVSPVSDTDEW